MPFLETISMFHKIKFSDSNYLYIFRIQKMKIPAFTFSRILHRIQLKASIFNNLGS